MTKVRKPKSSPFDEELTGKVAQDPDPIDPSDEELDEVFAGFPQNEACIELYRTTEKGGNPAFLDDIMPSDFSFGYVCKEYGGGRYIVKGKYKDGSAIKRSFAIEGDSYPVKRRVPVSPVPPAPVMTPAVPPVDMGRREDGSYDMAALVGGMMNMMKSLVQESKGNKAEWLAEMRTMQELFGGNKPTTPIQESIGLIKTGIELGSAAGGEGGGFPWLLALDKMQGPLTELISTIKTAVTQARPGGSPPMNTLGPSPVERPSAPVGAVKTEGEQMQGILIQALRSMLPMLVTGAAKEADPGFYADLLLDQIPRQYYATAKTWLEKPDCLEQLQGMSPVVTSYLIWFGSLRVELLKALSEELGGDAIGSVQSEPAVHAPTERTADL